jgi:OmpA-OmpF porin, OOP family
MGRILRLTIALTMTLLVGACVPSEFASLRLKSVPDGPPEKEIAEQLAHGYRLLADYDDYVARDADGAAHFRKKAQRAAGGETVEPDPAGGGDTGTALGMLLQARRRMDPGHNTDFAEAQVNYDCWVSRLNRREQSAVLCREKFYKAFSRLHIQNIASEPRGSQHYDVYFSKGSAVPDANAFATIRQAALGFTDNPEWRIHLTGHASGEKNSHANILLSMRRAMAVRNALLQNGVDAGRVVVGAIGETGVGKEKANSHSEGGSVGIAVVRVDEDRPDLGPDITKIVPQYFGKDEPEL